MERNDRTDWVMLGTLCLMPALFFWVINGLPIDMHLQSIPIFGGATQLEFLICAYFFPVISIVLGWNVYKRCGNRTESFLIIGMGLLELIIAAVITIIQ